MNPVIPVLGNRDRVRASRLVPHLPLAVQSKTIGTELSFSLKTENVSRTGLLLSWQQKRAIPFIENTIIEMTIDPDCQILKKPVSCLGKIVRRSGNKAENNDANQDLSFGVSIVQIENEDMDIWESCISEIADAATASALSNATTQAA